MTADRDALAELIQEQLDKYDVGIGGIAIYEEDWPKIADAIIAAGWTPPPRQRDCDIDGHDWCFGTPGRFVCDTCNVTATWAELNRGLD